MNAPGTLAQAAQLLASGQFDAAAAECRRMLAAAPGSAAALDLLGSVARARGQQAEALRLYTAAVAASPNAPMLHLHRGLALRACGGRTDEAIGEFRRSVELDPGFAEGHHQLGNVLKAAGRLGEALASLSVAARLAPDEAVVWLNLGVTQLELQRREDAIASFRRAIRMEPARPEAHNVLGVALLQQGEIAAAHDAFAEALRLEPRFAAARDNLARVFKAQGRIEDAIREFRAALGGMPDPATHSNFLYALNFAPTMSPEVIFAEHRAWAERHETPLRKRSQPHPHEFDPDRRLRVGFVSPDLVHHAVAYFFENVLLARDREQIEVTCYSDAAFPDAMTQRLRSLGDGWRDTVRLSDAALETLIRQDRIDVLVDMAGHTAHNRLLLFARKPAPVQITWLGYPNTTGLSAIDYRITDPLADPPGATERWHSERLIRLEHGFLCYRPPTGSPPVAALPAITRGFVTFASFSNFAKVSEPCLAVWAKVLRAVPNSRLMLKARGLGDRETIARLHGHLRDLGVTPDRVQLDARSLSVADHLALYGGVDIGLDPFPYNGTTTTCEALWMGVPVVTLAGETHVQRVGVSLLTHLAATDWIAHSAEGYVANCAGLAADRNSLGAIRASLRDRFLQSPICDAPRFMRHFEAALRAVWRERCGARRSEG